MNSQRCMELLNLPHTCPLYCHDDYEYEISLQNDLDAPMPWIGLYVAAASAICLIAMAADAIRAFKNKTLWFPCKYFSLNAFSLTLLAVAMKLPLDLTSNMQGTNDKLARVISLIMMSTALGNFMTSVATMTNNEILLNVTALSILVVTIAVNVCIQDAQISKYDGQDIFNIEQIGAIVFLLLLLALLFSSAVVVPTTKRYIELKYQEMRKLVSNERPEGGNLTYSEMRLTLMKYWVMAKTGSPQFVMARSVICVTSGFMCILMALAMVETLIRRPLDPHFRANTSEYKWSINWILFIQSGGVAVGTVAPAFRLFLAVQLMNSATARKSLKEEFKIEKYWTQRLVEWRESPLPLRIRHLRSRKVLHDAKRVLLNICIRVQILTILSSKLVLLVISKLVAVGSLFFHATNKLKVYVFGPSNDTRGLDSGVAEDLDLSPYVLLLENEPQLPKVTLSNISNKVDKLIQIGRREQPKNIVKLLQKSENFNGVREFDSSEVRSLHHQEPPRCWSLSVVTLTSIAIALPNIPNHSVNQLLSGVSEGLSFAKLIEKTLQKDEELISARNAADVVWVGVELYHKWQDTNIKETKGLKDITYKRTLQELSDIAKKTVIDFKMNAEDLLMNDPHNWPVKGYCCQLNVSDM